MSKRGDDEQTAEDSWRHVDETLRDLRQIVRGEVPDSYRDVLAPDVPIDDAVRSQAAQHLLSLRGKFFEQAPRAIETLIEIATKPGTEADVRADCRVRLLSTGLLTEWELDTLTPDGALTVALERWTEANG